MAWSIWGRKTAPSLDIPDDIPHRLLTEINRYRASWRIQDLELDQKLCDQAQYHSVEQAKMGQCSHFGSYGANPLTRAYIAGYTNPKIICENIAEGYATPIAVVKAWYNSAPHRRNLLERSCTKIGIGIHAIGATRYWTLIMISEPNDTTIALLSGPLYRSRVSNFHRHLISSGPKST